MSNDKRKLSKKYRVKCINDKEYYPQYKKGFFSGWRTLDECTTVSMYGDVFEDKPLDNLTDAINCCKKHKLSVGSDKTVIKYYTFE